MSTAQDRDILLGLTKAVVKLSGICSDITSQLPATREKVLTLNEITEVNDLLNEIATTMMKNWGQRGE